MKTCAKEFKMNYSEFVLAKNEKAKKAEKGSHIP